MNTYRVKKINRSLIKTDEDYRNEVMNANVHYCTGIKELREFCGGKVERLRNVGIGRCAYAGVNGDIEYVAERM